MASSLGSISFLLITIKGYFSSSPKFSWVKDHLWLQGKKNHKKHFLAISLLKCTLHPHKKGASGPWWIGLDFTGLSDIWAAVIPNLLVFHWGCNYPGSYKTAKLQPEKIFTSRVTRIFKFQRQDEKMNRQSGDVFKARLDGICCSGRWPCPFE